MKRHRAVHVVIQRAKIVLMAHQGLGTREISEGLSCSCRNVRKWKARFSANPSAESLDDQERSGRPAQIPVEIRCKLVQIACERPAAQESPAPLRDVWTFESLARSLE
ncbi:MAG: helix-turn-helix domain-containing protein [Myxococcales bacterium]|nr:helix-turn-helix domain-containing protein [Myxococcales bacterium]